MNQACPRTLRCRVFVLVALVSTAAVNVGLGQGLSPGTAGGISRLEAPEARDAAFRRKIDHITIPSVEFHATTLSDAIEFLRQESRRLDPDPDVEARGVNIVLRLPANGASTVTNQGAVTGSALSDPPVPAAAPRITLTMNRIPLLEALKYIAVQAGLKVRIDPYAISLVPASEDSDRLINATFRVAPGFIDNVASGNGKSALDQSAAAAH